MDNINKQAESILEKWYINSSFSEDNISVTNHEEFKLSIKDTIFSNKNLVLEINQQGRLFIEANNIKLFDFLSEELKNDKELILEIVKVNGENLQLVKGEFKDDKDIVLAAINSIGNSFEYASNRLKDDDEIVNLVIKKAPKQISNISDRFKNNKEFVVKLLEKYVDSDFIINMQPQFKSDIEVLLVCWHTIKDNFVHDNSRLIRHTKVLIDNMSEDISALFIPINMDLDNQEIIKQMDIAFDCFKLSKELTQPQLVHAKKNKV